MPAIRHGTIPEDKSEALLYAAPFFLFRKRKVQSIKISY